MAYPAFNYITPDDYLSIETRSNQKHEYFEGRIYDMAGNTFDHIFITNTLQTKMNIFLDGKVCEVFGSELRVTTPDFDSFMYPDLTISCDEIQKKENGFGTILNPTAIIEVLSSSTKGYDMAFKFHYYKQIPSLREYILVDSTKFFVQTNIKMNGIWTAEETDEINSTLIINTIGMEIPLRTIYSRASFFENKI